MDLFQTVLLILVVVSYLTMLIKTVEQEYHIKDLQERIGYLEIGAKFTKEKFYNECERVAEYLKNTETSDDDDGYTKEEKNNSEEDSEKSKEDKF